MKVKIFNSVLSLISINRKLLVKFIPIEYLRLIKKYLSTDLFQKMFLKQNGFLNQI